MEAPIVDYEDFWKPIEPLPPLPKPRRAIDPGHSPVPNRVGFHCIPFVMFVMKTGLRWPPTKASRIAPNRKFSGRLPAAFSPRCGGIDRMAKP